MSSVSVVMAVHNGGRFLEPQVRSVLAQLEPGDELIAIDDASTDDSPAFFDSLSHPALRLVRNDRNLGVLATFERGLSMARHDVVMLCDQDDIWLPGKRSAFTYAFAQAPQPLVVVSDAQVIDADGHIVAPSFMAGRGGFDASVMGTLWRNRFLGCAMGLRRELLDIALPIPRSVPMHDMWLGAIGALVGRVVYLPRPLLQYRRHGGNLSPSKRQGWRRMLAWRFALLAALWSRWPHRVLRSRAGRH
jgi:glycosyltransferase involved in cell wall biosynthesis